MENKEIDRILAEKVMGWHEGYTIPSPYSGLPSGLSYLDSKNHVIIYQSDWHPTEDIAQVCQCEEMLTEKQKWFYYLALSQECGVEETQWEGMHWTDILTMVHASLLQRATAIIKAIGE